MKFNKAYQSKTPGEFGVGGFPPSITEQSHKEAVSIQEIVKKYDRTGLITHVNTAVAQYGDFSEVNEYQEALNTIITAQNSFDALPAKVRQRFSNDPGAFFEFATDPKNIDEMISLGLAEKQPEVVPAEVPETTE